MPPWDLERFELEALLRDLAGEFAEAAQRTGVSIAVDVPQVLPGLWDRVALEQIIDNLVSNSLKYGARTPIKLRPCWRRAGAHRSSWPRPRHRCNQVVILAEHLLRKDIARLTALGC